MVTPLFALLISAVTATPFKTPTPNSKAERAASSLWM